MEFNHSIVDVTLENLAFYPEVVCYINPKNPYHHIKLDWIKQQYQFGLKIKLLYINQEKRPVGFIEYVPGEYCWRTVDAVGYMFIHCLWTNGKKYQHQGLGSLLINEVEKDAAGTKGVAVVTSDRSFMTNKKIFLKNGYTIAAESNKDQLLVKQFTSGNFPEIIDYKSNLAKFQDFTIIYSDQCPWVSRFIHEVKPVVREQKLKLNIQKISSASEAQQSPSLYSVFNLIYKGKILADRYISVTRFKNILNKENMKGE